jgi:hypothetical protein
MVIRRCVLGVISAVMLTVAACGPSNESEFGSQINPILKLINKSDELVE